MALMEHAIIATRPHTLAETQACNARFARARDFLLHSEPTTIMRRGLMLPPEEMAELRAEALKEMRSLCAACGLCARHKIKPP
jgi:hypothetical protein